MISEAALRVSSSAPLPLPTCPPPESCLKKTMKAAPAKAARMPRDLLTVRGSQPSETAMSVVKMGCEGCPAQHLLCQERGF